MEDEGTVKPKKFRWGLIWMSLILLSLTSVMSLHMYIYISIFNMESHVMLVLVKLENQGSITRKEHSKYHS